MSFQVRFALAAVASTIVASATPAFAADVYKCVSDLKKFQEFDNDQSARACSGLVNEDEVYKCVVDLKNYQGFTNDSSADACGGAVSADSVYKCVDELKKYQGFTNEQAAVACRTAH